MIESIEKIFEEVKNEFRAVGVRLKQDTSKSTAYYDYKTDTIAYNPEYIETNEKYAKDIFRHEFGHREWLVGSLENLIWQEIVLSQYAQDIEEISKVRNLFNDVGVDYRLIKSFGEKTKRDELKKNSPYFEKFRNSKLGGTLLKLLEKLTGRDWGSKTYDEKVLDVLLSIPWEDRGWKLGYDYRYPEAKHDLLLFYDAIKDLLEKEKDELPPMYSYTPHISEEEGRRIVKKLLKEGIVNSEEVSEWYKKRFPEKVEKIENRIKDETGILPGTEVEERKFPTLDILLQYLFEVDKYSVKVEPIMQSKEVEEITYQKPWDLGEPLRDIVWSTYKGIIIPGSTPMRNVRESTEWSLQRKKGFPNLLIILDDSGSRKWQYHIGFHEAVVPDVVIAGVVAKKYILEGSKVGVIKFSGSTQYFKYTNNLETVLYTLASFEGGGTRLDIEIVDKAVQEGRKGDILPDVLLVTDGEIDNAEELVKRFNKHAGRVWIFSMNSDELKKTIYYEVWKELKNGEIHEIRKPEEILKIVLK